MYSQLTHSLLAPREAVEAGVGNEEHLGGTGLVQISDLLLNCVPL